MSLSETVLFYIITIIVLFICITIINKFLVIHHDISVSFNNSDVSRVFTKKPQKTNQSQCPQCDEANIHVSPYVENAQTGKIGEIINIPKGTNENEIDNIEKFAVVTEIQPPQSKPIPTMKMNVSLNERNATGADVKKAYANMLKQETYDIESNDPSQYFHSKHKPMPAVSSNSLPAGKNGVSNEEYPEILGANYMVYNENPSPYNLDFPLYDKNKPERVVGVNVVHSPQ